MIQIKELRVGNYVSTVLGDKTVSYITDKIGIELDNISGATEKLDLEEINPILLTERIMMKLGFDLTFMSCYHLKLGGVYLIKPLKEATYYLVKSNGGDHLTSIKYVHQLQNFFYCMTGEELRDEY